MTDVAPIRPAGLQGRLPVKPEGKRFAIQWAHDYLAITVPPPTYPIDVSGGITDWGMLGNDQYGDCGEAGIRHVEMSTALAAKHPLPVVTDQQAINEYLRFTGGRDTGVNLADFLLWLYSQGRIKAFAPVDHRNAAIMDSLMAEFNGLYVGVNLTNDAQQLFGTGTPWTTANGELPDPAEGHCIVKVKANGSMDGWVTWGAVQSSTAAWSHLCVEEVWLVVTTQEELAKFTPHLLADIEALGGTGGVPAPAPQPAPKPTPAPTPTPAPASDVAKHIGVLTTKALKAVNDLKAYALKNL